MESVKLPPSLRHVLPASHHPLLVSLGVISLVVPPAVRAPQLAAALNSISGDRRAGDTAGRRKHWLKDLIYRASSIPTPDLLRLSPLEF